MINDVQVNGDVLNFVANNMLFEISLKDKKNFESIHIDFGTKNLTGGRKKMTSAILYELKQQPVAMDFIKNKCHEAIRDVYPGIEFSPDHNIWADKINSYFNGGNVKFIIGTLVEKTIEEQCEYIDEFIDTVFIPSKNGYNAWK